MVQADVKLTILLFPPEECWDFSCVGPRLPLPVLNLVLISYSQHRVRMAPSSKEKKKP